MFQWIRRMFRSKVKSKLESLEWDIKSFSRDIDRIKDKINLLNKLTNQKEHVTIERPSFMTFGGDTAQLREDAMEEIRKQQRAAGYSFCHKKENGDEVWAKY